MEETTNTSLSIFVTGATNFAGRAATRRLAAAGHQVTGMTVGTAGGDLVRADGGLPVYPDANRAGEIKSVLHMAQADVVLHVAPQAFNQVPHYKNQLDGDSLLQSTSAAVEAARIAGVKFFVHTSYVFLYGDQDGQWVDEQTPSHAPNGTFFKAALAAEKLVLESGVPACVLRAGYGYGDQSEALQSLANTMKRGRSVLTGSSTAYSNWLYADDLAAALALAAVHQKAGAVLNIVDDTPAAPAEFVNYLAEAMALSRPGGPFAFLTRSSTMQDTLLNLSVRAKNDRAKQDLGWTPKYASYRQGIERALLSWRAEQPLPA